MNKQLKKIIMLGASGALLCAASNAMAISGAYIGIKGGYNHMSFPDKTFTTDLICCLNSLLHKKWKHY